MVAQRRRKLVAARKAAGYTQEALAEALHVDRSTVLRWEAGEHVPWPYLWPKLARLLGVSKERLQKLFADEEPPLLWQADLPQPNTQQPTWNFSAGLNYGTNAIIGSSEHSHARVPMRAELLTQYESLTDNYRQIDYQAGARAVYGDTVAHLNRLLAAADQVPSKLYGRYIALLGDTAQLAAWLAIDSQDYPTARHFCSVALSSAEEGEDPTLHAYVLGVMSYIHLHAKRGNEAVRLLDGALRIANSPRLGVNPAVRSWLYEAMAEAYAFADNPRAGAKALAQAEQLFDTVQPDTVPHWFGFFNAQEHAARLKGRCLMRLGDGQAAVVTLQSACELLPEQYVRERSGTLIDLATAQMMETNRATNPSEPEAAADTLQEAWQLALLTESGRNQRRVRELLPAFKPYAHLESVQALTHSVH
ncbi:MAG TPA: helix-turn-helix transcriptional regulator [Actinophytocola sp.]|uniref:helix-turn-helix transcriptional regulator n=1 Tax=Actinophytocola sp. TaxID=1872138 RepID=UPI002DDD7C62|nr:helix-turn-helix transcriptional regulator [Actinophytocola sp.]HEV2777871.1 helix-turn-helix transcriptional regulator [Actinophytocola sp.]